MEHFLFIFSQLEAEKSSQKFGSLIEKVLGAMYFLTDYMEEWVFKKNSSWPKHGGLEL